MNKPITKSRLAIILSKLKGFDTPDIKHEQYITDPEIAAEILWTAYMMQDISESEIIDAGCGTGILGIGALLLNAKFVHFVDIDKKALEILKNNINYIKSEGLFNKMNYKIINKDTTETTIKANTTLQNPPFGVKSKHADKIFLKQAILQTKVIYSFHKSTSHKFIAAWCKDNNCKVSERFDFNFPLKQTYSFHRKRIQRIEVSCYRIISKDF